MTNNEIEELIKYVSNNAIKMFSNKFERYKNCVCIS